MIDPANLEGMVSAEEFEFLAQHASEVEAGCIVEVGSWRGKSAIALAEGAGRRGPNATPMVYCVEPHASAIGVYGGRFGPADRTAFYRAMLDNDMAERIALINLSSREAARGFDKPIGLIFIDGDHTEEGVERDVRGWTPHLTPGALVLFDDAKDDNIGPAKVIRRLLASGDYEPAGEVGKIIALRRKLAVGPLQPGPDRAANHAAVNELVAAAGYDPLYASSRLIYGSFASAEHKYLYVETPKAACTSIKHMMLELNDVRFDPRQHTPYFRETRLDMMVHQRALLQIPTALDLSPGDMASALAAEQGWLTFAVCRNPFSRLVSVYENKVRQAEPGYGEQCAAYAHAGYAGDVRAGFTNYVAGIRDLVHANADAHLTPQVDLLLVRALHYSRIYKVERLAELGEALSSHLGGRPITFGRFNTSRHADWRRYYTAETAKLVTELYAEDFSHFDYDVDSWATDVVDCIPEGELERGLLNEIRERNKTIEHLYDLIFAP